ncbi:hypothetical protein GCM10009838_15070 [Catenulispora subtropica]|uniref:Uncharacterized protein n=2 Tax=Catenulispora subtropica TaxID=450798 RepID=A0ABP5CAA1_9ACTN
MHPDSRLEPVATLSTAFIGGIVATAGLAAIGGTRHVDVDLAAYVGLAAVLGLGARWWAAPTAAFILWLFYDGFLVGRHGDLVWHGAMDGWRLGFIGAGALGGLLMGRVTRFAVAVRHR